MTNKNIVRHCVALARIATHMALRARRLGFKSKASLYSDRAKRHMAAAREFKEVSK